MPGSAFTPAAEAVRTIAPPLPPALSARIAACRVRKAPSRLMERTRRHSAKIEIGDRAAGADPGIDEGVGEAGQILLRPQILVGDVADHHLPLAGQREGEIAEPVLVAIGEDQLLRAGIGEAGGGGGADAGGGAGDQDDGIGEGGHAAAVAAPGRYSIKASRGA